MQYAKLFPLISSTSHPWPPAFRIAAPDLSDAAGLRCCDTGPAFSKQRSKSGGVYRRARSRTDVLGTVAVSAAQPGEVVTSARFISSELTATLVHGKNSDEITGEKSGEPGLESVHMVPISLADPEIIPLLNHGDTVSVITEDASGNSQTSFGADHRDAERGAENGLGLDAVDHAGIDHARNSISPYSGGPGQIESNTVIAEGARVILAREATSAGNRATVMLALPASAAQRVAVASLASPLTVVLTGERATGRDAH